MKFSPVGSILAVGSNDNFVDFYQTEGGFKKVRSGERGYEIQVQAKLS